MPEMSIAVAWWGEGRFVLDSVLAKERSNGELRARTGIDVRYVKADMALKS